MGNDISKEEKLYSLRQIQRGDHIKNDCVFYCHHYIVESVDIRQQKINVIHYNNNFVDGCKDSSAFGSLARVKRDSIDFNPRSLCRIVYKEERYSPKEVVKRALEKLGEKKYNPFTNNCEHFATWCKNGEAESGQATRATVGLGVTGSMMAVGGLIAGVAYLATQINKEPDEPEEPERTNRRQRSTRHAIRDSRRR